MVMKIFPNCLVGIPKGSRLCHHCGQDIIFDIESQMKKILITGIVIVFLLFMSEVADCRTWHQIGGPESGQIIKLIIDPLNPSILYTGSFGSGVYKSTDGGVNWIQINAGLPDGSDTYLLSMDPSNPATLYVGTVGDGVFKSTNGGNSWSSINTGLTSLRVHMAPEIDPSNPSILYVGTESGTEGSVIFKSINGGENWWSVSRNNGLPHGEVNNLAIDPLDSSTIYAGKHFDEGYHDGGVFKSTDGGLSWFPINTGLPDITSPDSGSPGLTIDPTNSQIVYVTNGGGIFKTTDGGQSWSSINTGLTTKSVYGLAIHPSNPEIIYVGTWGDGVFWSTNGGTNWQPDNTGLTNLNITGLAFDPSNPSTLYAGTYGDGVFKSAQTVTGNLVTSDLWIGAVINTEEKGPIEAVWKKGGEDTTSRGDRVIWGHFYASPNDVTWGSENNPDLFVKIWFDVGGRVDVNYFHVSVPDIEVYSDYPYDGTSDEQGTTTMDRRYIRQYYENGQSNSDENYEDGNPPAGYFPAGNPSGYSTINDLRIGSMINTVEKGPIDAIWRLGGQDTTSRGDEVVWGHFYASPNDVTWGSSNNPDLFMKIWFDVSGRVDVNFFHVSVPDIEVYSDLPNDNTYDQQGTTIMNNRYIRHEYWR
jgi:photosystem II stability/assembly factor-like uncharacterized protein